MSFRHDLALDLATALSPRSAKTAVDLAEELGTTPGAIELAANVLTEKYGVLVLLTDDGLLVDRDSWCLCQRVANAHLNGWPVEVVEQPRTRRRPHLRL